jgi:hypothetical protein
MVLPKRLIHCWEAANQSRTVPSQTPFYFHTKTAEEARRGHPTVCDGSGGAYFFLPSIRALRYLARAWDGYLARISCSRVHREKATIASPWFFEKTCPPAAMTTNCLPFFFRR